MLDQPKLIRKPILHPDEDKAKDKITLALHFKVKKQNRYCDHVQEETKDVYEER